LIQFKKLHSARSGARFGEAEAHGVANSGGSSGYNCYFAFKAEKLNAYGFSIPVVQSGGSGCFGGNS
jgi:hypothetical protein